MTMGGIATIAGGCGPGGGRGTMAKSGQKILYPRSVNLFAELVGNLG